MESRYTAWLPKRHNGERKSTSIRNSFENTNATARWIIVVAAAAFNESKWKKNRYATSEKKTTEKPARQETTCYFFFSCLCWIRLDEKSHDITVKNNKIDTDW